MPLRASRFPRLLEELQRVSIHLKVSAHCPDWRRMYDRAVGGDVDVRATRFFAHLGKPGVGMLLK